MVKRDFEKLGKSSSELHRRLNIILEMPKLLGSASDLFYCVTPGKKDSD